MRTRTRALAVLMSAAAAVAALPAVAVAAPAPAPVAYAAVADGRSLTFLNAPERLLTGEDTDRDMIYRGSLDPGSHRIVFEHGNYGATAFTYGLLLQNVSSCDLSVRVERKGYGTFPGAGVNAARPVADMLNGAGGEAARSLPAGTSAWLFTATAPAGAFFTGALDLTTTRVAAGCAGGAVFLKAGVFTALPTPAAAAALPYRGADNGNGQYNDRKVYNGRVTVPYAVDRPTNEVATQDLSWTLDAGTTVGSTLPVTYRGQTRDRWTTHATPSRKAQAVGTDMLSVWMPLRADSFALTEINPFEIDPRNTDGTTGNLANWGVVETSTGTIRNTTGTDRTVTFVVRQGDTGGNVRFALRCTATGAWTAVDFPAGAPQDTRSCQIPVPAGQAARFTVSTILGGPSIGVLEHALTVTA